MDKSLQVVDAWPRASVQLTSLRISVVKLHVSIISALAAILFQPVFAQDQPADLIVVPEPPPLPLRIESGEIMEPDITISTRQDETLVEYRHAGRLVAVKVIPKNESFPAYYLVDGDGDGRLDTRTHELGPDFLVNSWVLFSW